MSKKLCVAASVGIVGALVAGVCLSSTAATAVGGRSTMTITIHEAGKVTGSTHARPGFAEINAVSTKGRHLLQLARARNSGTTKAEFLRDAALVNEGKPAALEAAFKTVGGVETGHSLWIDLDPGTYYAIDLNARKESTSKVLKMRVSGSRINSAKPTIAGTITSVGDMKFSMARNHIPTSGNLEFANRSLHNANNTHFLEFIKLKKGKGYSDVRKAFQGKENPSTVFASGKHTSYFVSGVVSFNKTEVTSYSISKGRWAVACFFPDRANGQPHAFMGMYRVINVG